MDSMDKAHEGQNGKLDLLFEQEERLPLPDKLFLQSNRGYRGELVIPATRICIDILSSRCIVDLQDKVVRDHLAGQPRRLWGG